MKIHKDKNGVELNIGDTVTAGTETFIINEFKIRSNGFVVYNEENGNAYNTGFVEKVIEEPPADSKSQALPTGWNF